MNQTEGKPGADPFQDDPFGGPDAPLPSDAGAIEDDPFADDPFASDGKGRPSPEKPAERKKRFKTEPEMPAISIEVKPPKVQLPPPAKIASSSGSRSGDTSISGAPLPQRRRLQALPIVTAACLLVVVGVTLGGFSYLDHLHLDEEKKTFLRYAKRHDPEASLLAYERLPEELREDSDVLRVKQGLEDARSGETARREAEDRLEGLDRLVDDAARIAACTEAIAADPAFAAAYVARARLRARAAARAATASDDPRQVYAPALEDLEAALGVEPARPDALLTRAMVVLRYGETEEAKQLLGVARKSTTGAGTLALGWQQLLGGDAKRARETFAAAARRKTSWIVHMARVGEARAALALGDLPAVKVLADRARREDPEAPDPHWLLAESEPAGADAKRALERALALDPLNARAHALQARLALLAGDEPGARTAATRARALDPGSALAWLVEAELRVRAGELAAARTAVGSAIATAWVRGDLVRALVLHTRLSMELPAHAKALDPKQALAHLDRALALEPGNGEALAMRAELRARQGEREGALEDLNLALAGEPATLPAAYLLRARLHLRTRPCPIPQVLGDLNRVLELDPGRLVAHLHRAQAYALASRFDDALRDLEQAKGGDPAEVALLRGDCLYGLGRWKDALDAYREQQRLQPGGPQTQRVKDRLRECEQKAAGSGEDF